jgi:hypothetical protein
MLIPFGVLSAAGAAVGDVDAYELISTTVLGGTAASVTFSNLGDYASTYKSLQIRATARSTRAGASIDGLGIRLNGDTAANYTVHFLRGENFGVISGASTGATLAGVAIISAPAAVANSFGAVLVDFLDPYSTTKNTTVRALGGSHLDAGITAYTELRSAVHLSTAAVSSILLFATTGGSNLVAGSRFSLYGIRG